MQYTMTSADLDKQFNSFLDTWMMDAPQAGLGREEEMQGRHDMSQSMNPTFTIPPVLNDGVPPSSANLFDSRVFEPEVAQTIPGAHDDFNFGYNANTTFTGAPLQFQAQASAQQPAQLDSSNGPGRSSSGPSRHSNSSDVDVAAPSSKGARKEKLLEKNRRAQKRFRDKQKAKMVDMEAQVEHLQKEMSDMSVEKTCLQRQNEVLQKVLELRQKQIETLTEAARLHEEPAESARINAQQASIAPGLEEGLTVADCRKMSASDVISKWRSYVERMAVLLVEAELPVAPPEAVSALDKLCYEAGNFCSLVATVNPVAIKVLIISNMDTGHWDESLKNDPRHWTATIESIMLTEDQKDKILYLVTVLQRNISQFATHRAELCEQLKRYLPNTFGPGRSLGACIHSNQAMNRLRKNFQAEHEAWTSFIGGVLSKVLTTLQFARFCTKAYPLFPNTLQIAKHLISSGYQAKGGLGLDAASKLLAICDIQGNKVVECDAVSLTTNVQTRI